MVKQILLILVLVVSFNALFVFSGGMDTLLKTGRDTTPVVSIPTDVVDVFQFTLEHEVQQKIGIPKHGYEPQMFLKVFPGLVVSDFSGVQSNNGIYRLVSGQLEYEFDRTQLAHTAAKAISRNGMETLLENVARRIGVDFENRGTITEIMAALITKV